MLLNKYKKGIALISLAGVLVACGGNELEDKKKELHQKQDALVKLEKEIKDLETKIEEIEGPKESKVVLKPVTVFNVEAYTFRHFVDVPGDVISNRNVVVAPETTGRIVRRFFEEGAYVRRGQRLAKLDVEILQKQIEEVEKSLELADIMYEKQSKLWEQNIGSEVQYLQAKNNKESLEAKLASLKEQEAKGYIIAPISGKIDEVYMKEGEMAPAGQPYARVVDINNVEVVAEVSEKYSRDVKRGDEVNVKFPMLDFEKAMKVNVVGQTINQTNRTFKIRMKLNEKGLDVKPNTMAVVTINDYSKDNAVAIPSNLVQKNTQGETFTYILTNDGAKKNIVKKVEIKTGKSYKGKTMITEGITAGMVVIDKGYSEVVVGEEVRVVDYKI
ncbi:efflux RND transporter periplasmic adaptor subunit [Flammeovirga yaeyamensis]|uniref:Efflux RND transporter periplasmic adaptor subunit n=1 Tax=Flammeovirga yaeyamensis TaxID=367791 RepID=A0AAX1N4S5_9BACT|nr:efflux RND transporter periplasmic adaptor subunit [Flammeovirga yaeyamensis]MBB3700351.1 RND family efflux transporter MFP subunit [Flammeovirga yaeyamensis]NMF37023.1 efflux RND transporter periplasmic adaptor subunit [Flammeovirga yaeyamensis]QWG02434.1 efflux RND transporter periplasmic adaptor subunit [Flammeovirga yaeyamensis]